MKAKRLEKAERQETIKEQVQVRVSRAAPTPLDGSDPKLVGARM